jgi:nitrate reductase delta subunit
VEWIQEKQLIFKLCSIFLGYPSKDWVGNKEMEEIIHSIEDIKVQKALFTFWNYTLETDFDTLTTEYVRWFDLRESTTLYLTYGIFGDNRERGPAFVKLKMEFAKAGFYLKENELPDYLPLILDFASIADIQYVKKVFAIHYKAIETLYTAMSKEKMPYNHLLDACMVTIDRLLPSASENMNHNAV